MQLGIVLQKTVAADLKALQGKMSLVLVNKNNYYKSYN